MSNQLLKSTTIVSFMTFMSRIVGFIRDMVLAQLFGATAGFDAFLLAFKIPNFMRRLFAEGAFSQAFVPVLSEYHAIQDVSSVKVLMNKVFTALSVVTLGVSFIGVMLASWFVRIFAPGFDATDPRFLVACHLLHITFPYVFFISLTAFAGGVQNVYRQFAVPAVTPVLLNISLIMAAIVGSAYCEEPVIALAWGVLAAGLVQLLFQVPFLVRLGLTPSFAWSWNDPGVKKVLLLMGPAIVGASVMQINLLVDTIFASFLSVGSLTWLYYSDRLLEFPIGIFGVALATVVLPHLSHEYAQKSHAKFSASIDWALRWIVFIGVPASIGLVLLAGPLMATLFQYGQFLPRDSVMASYSLMALSAGLVCFLGVKVLVSAFYARQNTKFPVKVAIFSMLTNVIFNFLLIGPLAHAGLALASSLSSFCNVAILLRVLLKQKIYVPMPGWKEYGVRLLIANVAMAGFILCFSPELVAWVEGDLLFRVRYLVLLIIGSVGAYFGGLWLIGLRVSHLQMQNIITDLRYD